MTPHCGDSLSLGLFSLLFLTLGLACGDDNASKPDGDAGDLPVFARQDSSVIQFPTSARVYVWCGPWEEDNVLTPALHVFHGSVTEMDRPGWDLRAVYGDFASGDTLRFPSSFVWDQPDSAHLFLFDPPNELSTGEAEAGGYIVFRQLPCPGSGAVEFEIDAILGSEYGDLPTVSVRGRFRHAYTGPPPWIGR